MLLFTLLLNEWLAWTQEEVFARGLIITTALKSVVLVQLQISLIQVQPFDHHIFVLKIV